MEPLPDGTIDSLVTRWTIKPKSLTVQPGFTPALGADPKRWQAMFQGPVALPPVGVFYVPGGTQRLIQFALDATVARFDQKDWGPFASGSWEINNTSGGAVVVSVCELCWE